MKLLHHHTGIPVQTCHKFAYSPLNCYGKRFISLYSSNNLILAFVASCSHKRKVLDFLDQMCAFYEHEYMLASSVVSEGNQAFIDKVCDLADANGLSSKGLRTALSEFSVDELRGHLNKVYR